MTIIDDRNEQLKVVAEVTVYFKEHGLLYNFEAFFARDAVKGTLHEIYEVFTADAEKIISNLPGPAQKRGYKHLEEISLEENFYVENVKNSFLCTLALLLQNLNRVVSLEDTLVIKKMNQAFISDSEGKMLEEVTQIAYELKKIMLEDFRDSVNRPDGIPNELADVLLSINGGKPIVTLQEVKDYKKRNASH